MRHSPDNEYNYIGHFMDHFSKFHVLFPCIEEEDSRRSVLHVTRTCIGIFGPTQDISL